VGVGSLPIFSLISPSPLLCCRAAPWSHACLAAWLPIFWEQLVAGAALFLSTKSLEGCARPVHHVAYHFYKVKYANKPDELAKLARDAVSLCWKWRPSVANTSCSRSELRD
jgi:hypothetical protein